MSQSEDWTKHLAKIKVKVHSMWPQGSTAELSMPTLQTLGSNVSGNGSGGLKITWMGGIGWLGFGAAQIRQHQLTSCLQP